MKILCIN